MSEETSNWHCPCGCGKLVLTADIPLIETYRWLEMLQPGFESEVKTISRTADRAIVDSMTQRLLEGTDLRISMLSKIHAHEMDSSQHSTQRMLNLFSDYTQWGFSSLYGETII